MPATNYVDELYESHYLILSELESNFWEPYFRSAFATSGGPEE